MTEAGRLRVCAAAIVVAATLAAAAASFNNSATNDEPFHTLAGFLYVAQGHGDLNPEHPPLTKLLSGSTLQALGLRGTVTGPVQRLRVLSEELRAFIYFNTASSESILRLARAPMLAFLIALLVGVWVWARFAWGERAALYALLATACQPLVLGHAGVVHTDVPAAATWVWTGLLLHRWLAGAPRGWIWVGAALGIALLTKFSAVLLAILVAVTVGVAAVRQRRWRDLARLACSAGIALVVLVAGMWAAVRNVSVDEELATVDAYMSLWPGGQARAEWLKTAATVSVPLAHWALGMAYVAETNEHGQGVNFLLGRTSTRSLAAYFPVAFALKTSLPLLVLTLVGAAWVAVRRDGLGLALLGVVVCYFLVSVSASYNIGARHLMPVIPLVAMVAAQPVAVWPRWARLAVAAGLLASPLAAFPHYIAHFSLAAGGTRHGATLLTDSNVDWGQDWRRLGREAAAKGWAPMTYLYLGAGFPARDVPGARDALDLTALPAAGHVAVSRFAKTVGVEYLRVRRAAADANRLDRALDTLRARGELLAVVGGSIEVYRLAPAASQP